MGLDYELSQNLAACDSARIPKHRQSSIVTCIAAKWVELEVFSHFVTVSYFLTAISVLFYP